LQGGDREIAEALGRGDLAAAPVTDAERALLSWIELLTEHAYKNTAADVDRVRQAGWTDDQISEASFVAAMFAFFNRVADAFGLVDPGYDKLQPPAGKLPE
jgi:alkylhydroperoxidase family enzyme